MEQYPFKEIEEKWQQYWDEKQVYKVTEDPRKKKFYVLDMFPYPSGSGLHIGHPEGYTATDIIARYKTMKGYNVLHPMGFDAFGLPTERYCMETGIHPVDATNRNIATFKRQLKQLGLGYDWSREVNTTDPNYYKWTQWMFLLIYNSWFDEEQQKARSIDELPIPEYLTDTKEINEYIDSQRLAYIAMIPVNWCEQLGTVLANEEVDEWREKGYEVERRPMRQWMLRITKYARRLLEDLDIVDWPTSTMEMQKNWIGKSEGADILFRIKDHDKNIRVFTTRPDTIFGATYMVLAPEHDLVREITTDEKKEEVDEYIKQTSFKSELERTELTKDKTGVFTGAYAVNPATGKEIPIWIADYVLLQYGTGAIMAVPGQDERDWEFAEKYNLPIIRTVQPPEDFEEKAYLGDGPAINSDFLNGLNVEDAIDKITKWLEEKGFGQAKTEYRLRDWLFSRQRYWGEPIPVIYFEDGTKRALEPDELPLELPDLKNKEDFKPAGTGESPLANIDEWVNFTDPKTGKKARYETNTMPQWAGSCWYYLRYCDPHNDGIFCDPEKENYWMQPDGVDLYVGGSEHAVLHLLYARFWHKVLYDHGYVSAKEPFKKLYHQGLIMGEMEYTLFLDQSDNPVSAENVSEQNTLPDGMRVKTRRLDEKEVEKIREDKKEYFVWADNKDIRVDARVFKMSKSRGNVINPDTVIEEYGADSLRILEMFLGPLEQAKPWSTSGIEGVHRFLGRVWRLFIDRDGNLLNTIKEIEPTPEQEYILHSTIKKVSEDIENLSFNTAISQMMIFVNEFNKAKELPRDAMKKFVLLLAPFAPHIAEELWEKLGHHDTVSQQSFPEYNEEKTKRSQIQFVVQVNSKIRAKLQVSADITQEEAEKLAREEQNVQRFLEGKEIKKVVFVPKKLINFIVA